MAEFHLLEGPAWTRLVSGDREVVDKLLVIADPDAPTSASVAARLHDGLIHFFDREREASFPAGLTWRLRQRLERRGHVVRVDRDPDYPPIAPPAADCLAGVTLREHQCEAVAAALHHRRGIIWAATNSGKTEEIAALIYAFRAAGLPSPGLVISPNTEILKTLRARLAKRIPDLRVGLAGDGQRQLDGDVVIATYQTLQQATGANNTAADPGLQRLVELAGYVLVDEAHHAAGQVYQRLLRMSYNAVYRLGFTGTADKSSRRDDVQSQERTRPAAVQHRWLVEGALGPVLHRTENSEMIAKGFSARPTIYVVDDRAAFGPAVPKLFFKPGSKVSPYGKTFELAVIKDRRYHISVARVVRRLLEQGKPPWVFSHSVEHLTALSAVLTERGVPHKLLSGKSSSRRRDQVVELFTRQQDFAILTSPIFDEGADVPEIRAAVLAGARRAVVELLQRIGRGIRAKAADNTLTVVDFKMPHCAMLAEHFKERYAVFKTEGFKVRWIKDITRLSEVEL